MMEAERSFSFTAQAQRHVFETTENLTFLEADAEMIFQTLREHLRVVPFNDYLKRYIYQRSGMFGSFREIPLREYQKTILASFHETGTPASLHRSKSRLQTRSMEWLCQTTVRRNQVLLLGFGLSMDSKDVNLFLTRGIHDHEMDMENPLEAICEYCYSRRYGFSKMEQLWKIYEATQPEYFSRALIEANHPLTRAASRTVMEEDYQLMSRLMARKEYHGPTTMRNRSRFHFQRLYQQVCRLLAERKDGEGEAEKEIQPHEIEEILCASIPRDHHGNLVADMGTEVRYWLAGKRFSRQHLHQPLRGNLEPSRYDLITLRFLISCEGQEVCRDRKERYHSFLGDMNHILRDCGFGELYSADPYESFILMCLLADDPLGTYSDVIEISYDEAGKGAGANE